LELNEENTKSQNLVIKDLAWREGVILPIQTISTTATFFFCNMQRILLFSVVYLSKYESYVLPHTSNPYRILGWTKAK